MFKTHYFLLVHFTIIYGVEVVNMYKTHKMYSTCYDANPVSWRTTVSIQINIHGDVMLAWNQPWEYLYTETGKHHKSDLDLVLMLKEFSVNK